jgi:hypothetical protein
VLESVTDPPRDPATRSDPPRANEAPTCTSPARWLQREPDSALGTPPGWLAIDADSTALFWSQVEAEPRYRLLDLDSGEPLSSPDLTGPAMSTAQLDPSVPWRTLVGVHSVSARMALATVAKLFPSTDNRGLVAEAGGIAVTPDGAHLVQALCTAGAAELAVWNTNTGLLHARYTLEQHGAACVTAFTLTNGSALIGDRASVREISLDDGTLRGALDAGGPVGRIDASAATGLVAFSILEGDLIALDPGPFAAVTAITDLGLSAIAERVPCAGALMNVSDSSPGSVAIPLALHPSTPTVATFNAAEHLVLTQLDTQKATILDWPPDDTVLGEVPRESELPILLSFAPDGRTLSSLRGRTLSVFDCNAKGE